MHPFTDPATPAALVADVHPRGPQVFIQLLTTVPCGAHTICGLLSANNSSAMLLTS